MARDAEGADLGPVGLRDGRVAGSFIHLIDREGDENAWVLLTLSG